MKETKTNLKRLWPYLRKEKLKMFLIVIFNIFLMIASVIFPLLSAQIIIKLTSNLIEQFLMLAICESIISVLADTFDYLSNRLYTKLHLDVSLKIQEDLGKELLKLNNKTLDTNGSGVFVHRLMGDANNLSLAFERITIHIRAILSNIGVFISVYVINKVVFLYVMFIISIRIVIEFIRLKIRKNNMNELKKITDSSTGFANEMISGIRDIKMLNSEESFLDTFHNKFEFLNNKAKKVQLTNLNLLFLRWIWSNISSFCLYLIIAWLILNQKLEATFAIIILNYSGRWNSFAGNITSFLDILNDFDISATRLFEIIDGDKYPKEHFGSIHLDKVNGNFEFNKVSFAYDNKKILKNLSFKVNANETVAFVGKSGVGKTTIFNLLCKMYDNYKGTITIDNHDIRELDKDTIRGNITIVSQDPYIFNLSIKDNLKLVCKDLTNKQMKEVCKLACLDKFIESLPDKYDTIVGEGGVTLSGGQKQRLAIARAFLQKTEIILFDEATSALDNETQSEISKAINNLKKDYTILIIAHRLSTIKNADRIIFIEDGTIKQEGTHDELLKTCESYKELYESEIEK